jgi:hypothetical protein
MGAGLHYGEERIVAILAGFDRLRTFAMIEKLRRGLPLLAQSFDCFLRPEFDVLEYDAAPVAEYHWCGCPSATATSRNGAAGPASPASKSVIRQA